MKSISKIILGIVSVFVIVFCLVYFKFGYDIDFSDNPALIVEVDDNGTVTLDTYQGTITGILKGVRWSKNKIFREKAKNIISKAQVDKVAYVVKSNGEIIIWYQTIDGARNLNKDIQNIQ